MSNLTKVVQTFPSVRLPSESGGLAVEVCLIAQLGPGAGNHLFASVVSRQRQHAQFVDELEEPSAKLAGTNFDKGDATSLYSFVVGPTGHPFHRHAGHRVFTAVSGSGGAQLRFSSASDEQLKADPHNFLHSLRFINIPPDCMFTVRFGGETWHQFFPLSTSSLHPAFFALSCHTNELGGNLSDELKAKVIANEATIPSLTELLPDAVLALLQSKSFNSADVPTTALSLDAPPGTVQRVVCNTMRCSAGILRGAWSARRRAGGYLSYKGNARKVTELATTPDGSLLLKQFAEEPFEHGDTFSLTVTSANLRGASASKLLVDVLEGFLLNPPDGVSRLMALRNVLVKPMGLRTSPLGCPVSSLLAPHADNMFAGQYPVMDQLVDPTDARAQVILGANDKHLQFRSCVGVHLINDHQAEITLGTRVRCKNWFGRFYMALINRVHRAYITPTMLRLAVEYALANEPTSPAPVQVRTQIARHQVRLG